MIDIYHGEYSYWCSFEYEGGAIGTYSDYAPSPDAFMQLTLEREQQLGLSVKRFTELHEHSTARLGGKKISIRKYNQWLRQKHN